MPQVLIKARVVPIPSSILRRMNEADMRVQRTEAWEALEAECAIGGVPPALVTLLADTVIVNEAITGLAATQAARARSLAGWAACNCDQEDHARVLVSIPTNLQRFTKKVGIPEYCMARHKLLLTWGWATCFLNDLLQCHHRSLSWENKLAHVLPIKFPDADRAVCHNRSTLPRVRHK